MKFSIGDRVLLKQTGDEGIITAFLSRDLIEVEIGDIRFPVYADQIDHPYLKWFTDPKKPKHVKREKEIPVESEAKRLVKLSRGIYLSFLPQFAQGTAEDIIEAFRIHLLNETADDLIFSYHAKRTAGGTLLQLNGTLHPFGNIFLHTLSLEDMNAQPRFHWSIAPKDNPAAGVKDVLRIRPAQLIRYINALLSDGQPSFSVLLAQDAEAIPVVAPVDALSLTQVPSSPSASNVQLNTEAVAVLDLHLNESNEDATHLLSAQIRLLEQKMDAAYVAGQDKMVVIHGIGNGTLREAVHNILKDTPYVHSFSNHWMAAYGWGATEIIFQKS
jgi:hypothetical protein